MSSISGFDPITTSGAAGQSPNAFGDMSSEDFINIIFTELTNQDPLSPSDTSALLEQLNSIRSIESDIKLQQQLEKLVTENKLVAASNMIGDFIGGFTEDFTNVAGYVVSVIKQGDSISLELDNGWVVPVENVTTVIDPDLFEDEDPIDETPGGDDDDDDPVGEGPGDPVIDPEPGGNDETPDGPGFDP